MAAATATAYARNCSSGWAEPAVLVIKKAAARAVAADSSLRHVLHLRGTFCMSSGYAAEPAITPPVLASVTSA